MLGHAIQPTFIDRYFSWLPFVSSPAVTADGLDTNHEKVRTRSLLFFIPLFILCLGMSAIEKANKRAALSGPVNPPHKYSFTLFITSLALLALGLVTLYIERRRACRIVDSNVVNNYLANRHPSSLSHLSTCTRALRLLIERRGDLNKSTEDGQHLLADSNMDFGVFKLAVNNGFDLAQKEGRRYSGFHQVVASKNPVYLRHLIDNKLISIDNFDKNAQVEFWADVGHEKSVDLLINFGFDINVRNTDGHTPLGVLSQRRPDFELSPPRLEKKGDRLRRLTSGELIEVLRKKGALE